MTLDIFGGSETFVYSISSKPSHSLADINECVDKFAFCGPNSICTNTIGSYNCSCSSGFTVTNRSQPVSNSNPCNGKQIEMYESYRTPFQTFTFSVVMKCAYIDFVVVETWVLMAFS